MIDAFFQIYGKAFDCWKIQFQLYGYTFSFFELFFYGVIVAGAIVVLFAVFGDNGKNRRS